MAQYENGLFIFRRDLRIIDNNGLNLLNSKCKNIYTIFIFTPEQIDDNPYKSSNAIQFMINSLVDLEEAYLKNGIKLLYLKKALPLKPNFKFRSKPLLKELFK